MKRFSQYIGEELQIRQLSIWKRVHELRTPDSVLMTLTYPKWYSANAVIAGFGETWEIYKPSIWRSHLEIRKQGNQLPFAKFAAEKWGRGGVFELPNGERLKYLFKMWKGYNEIYTQRDEKLVSFHRKFSFKPVMHISIDRQSGLLDAHPWVIMAIYCLMLERRQSAAQ